MKKKILTKDGQPVDEHKTFVQKFGIIIQKYIPSEFVSSFLSKGYCSTKGRSTNIKDIIEFITKYHVDWKNTKKCKHIDSMKECITKYKTLNDFFIRKKVHINIYKKNKNNYFVSPSDSRTLLFDSEKKSRFWIKGKHYTISNMMQLQTNILKKYYTNSYTIISRLAPVDYHRFHSPISGKLVYYKIIHGSYLSVDPSIVRSSKNVFSKNTRVLYYISTKYYGVICMVIVGAVCIGSIIVHKKKKNSIIQKGDELGYFQFGGSTIVTIIPKLYTIEIDKAIQKHSSKKIETYVEVGDHLLYTKPKITHNKRIEKRIIQNYAFSS